MEIMGLFHVGYWVRYRLEEFLFFYLTFYSKLSTIDRNENWIFPPYRQPLTESRRLSKERHYSGRMETWAETE
jgi:hypothetical protein